MVPRAHCGAPAELLDSVLLAQVGIRGAQLPLHTLHTECRAVGNPVSKVPRALCGELQTCPDLQHAATPWRLWQKAARLRNRLSCLAGLTSRDPCSELQTSPVLQHTITQQTLQQETAPAPRQARHPCPSSGLQMSPAPQPSGPCGKRPRASKIAPVRLRERQLVPLLARRPQRFKYVSAPPHAGTPCPL